MINGLKTTSKHSIAPGIIVRKFRESDENTIIRLPNLRRFVKNNNIKYIMVGRNWLIDGDRFMEVVNPSKIDCRYEIPKIRTLRSAIKEFKSRYIYKKTIRPELIAEIVKTENITAYYMGNKWLLNYDELEPCLLKRLNAKFRQ